MIPPLQKKVQTIFQLLQKEYPNAQCSLHFTNHLQLLIAVILSAQCTDKKVNEITPSLFQKYKTAQDFANADLKDLENILHPLGFYRSKAKAVQETCRRLCSHYNGKVPNTMKDLLTLRGVARKTANVVLAVGYGIPAGIVVDTHVKRICQRLGLTKQNTPQKIEQELMKIVPKSHWIQLPHLLIWHGRAICRARNPLCHQCTLLPHCPHGQNQTQTSLQKEKKYEKNPKKT
ncbi:MAG: endonuclease III [Planctomycetota bacterium]|nr:MAG: endonuclease III [Planctomycetota bacterium]